MWEYNNRKYKNQKELKALCGLPGAKFRAKIKDGEIKRITNTGLKPYEELHPNTEYDKQ